MTSNHIDVGQMATAGPAAVATYERAQAAHAAAKESLEAARAYLDACRVRERELHAEACEIGARVELERGRALDALLDRQPGAQAKRATERMVEAEHALAMHTAAIQRMVTVRLPDAQRAILTTQLQVHVTQAELMQAIVDARMLATAGTIADLARLEGTSIEVRGTDTERMQREVVRVREWASASLRSIEEHDQRTARLRKEAL